MFSIKKNVLQIVALIKAYGISQIIISPGSRNAPLIQTFASDPFFRCHTIVDERNAAFYALGVIQAVKEPVVVCCTSGSALLNYAPAVSEAYYQQLPLIVLSADRSAEWIGQMDGQTIPQTGIFGCLSKKSVQLPEIKTDTDEWFCNRLINEALISCTSDAMGPVHINIPLSEPLFDYSATELPQVRLIKHQRPQKNIDILPFRNKWKSASKRLIVVGQLNYNPDLINNLEKIIKKTDCVVFSEHLSNCTSPLFINNFDTILNILSDSVKSDFVPDLVVTLGGHIVSKRLKHFLRAHKPQEHWQITESGEIVDLFQSLTDLIETDALSFISTLTDSVPDDADKPFFDRWKNSSERAYQLPKDIPFCDLSVTEHFISCLPQNSVLQIANSSSVRNTQLYNIDRSIKIFCNRGVNGIESALPTSIGFASVYDGMVYLITGDLSFFYGLNALWNIGHIKNLRILLINNGGGGIFHLLPGLDKASSLNAHVAANHHTNARDWTKAANFRYLAAENDRELKENMKIFVDESNKESIIFETFTDISITKQVLHNYYEKLRKK